MLQHFAAILVGPGLPLSLSSAEISFLTIYSFRDTEHLPKIMSPAVNFLQNLSLKSAENLVNPVLGFIFNFLYHPLKPQIVRFS